jgi:DNA-binding beta-propeller fold protein YncE
VSSQTVSAKRVFSRRILPWLLLFSASPNLRAQVVYVLGFASGQPAVIDAFSIGFDGTLTPAAESAPFSSYAYFLQAAPAGQFLFSYFPYAPNGIRIDSSTGEMLAPLESLGSSAESAAICPSGKFVYSVTGTGGILGHVADASAVLTPFQTSASALATNDQVSLVCTSSGFLYIASLVNATVQGFYVNGTTGALTAASGPHSIQNVAAMTTDVSGKFLFIISGQQLLTYQIDRATGNLQQLPTVAMPNWQAPAEVAVDPLNRFLYVYDRDRASFYGFRVNSLTGALTPIGGSPFPVGIGGQSFTLDPAGRFLYSITGFYNASSISAFRLIRTVAQSLPWRMLLYRFRPTGSTRLSLLHRRHPIN